MNPEYSFRLPFPQVPATVPYPELEGHKHRRAHYSL
jgi:hypothetical protein